MRPWLAASLLAACAHDEPETSSVLASADPSPSEPVLSIESIPTPPPVLQDTVDIYALHAKEIMGWARPNIEPAFRACAKHENWEDLSKDERLCVQYVPLERGEQANIVLGGREIFDSDRKVLSSSTMVVISVQGVPCEIDMIRTPNKNSMAINYGDAGQNTQVNLYTWSKEKGASEAIESRPGLAGEADFAEEWFY